MVPPTTSDVVTVYRAGLFGAHRSRPCSMAAVFDRDPLTASRVVVLDAPMVCTDELNVASTALDPCRRTSCRAYTATADVLSLRTSVCIRTFERLAATLARRSASLGYCDRSMLR